MVAYIDTILNQFLSDCARLQIGDFKPKEEKDESLTKHDSVCIIEKLIEGESISYVSPFPKIGNRRKKHYIRYLFER